MELFKKAGFGGTLGRALISTGAGIGASAYLNRKAGAYANQYLTNSGQARNVMNAQQQLEALNSQGLAGSPQWEQANRNFTGAVKKFNTLRQRSAKAAYGLGVAGGIGTAVLTSKLLRHL